MCCSEMSSEDSIVGMVASLWAGQPKKSWFDSQQARFSSLHCVWTSCGGSLSLLMNGSWWLLLRGQSGRSVKLTTRLLLVLRLISWGISLCLRLVCIQQPKLYLGFEVRACLKRNGSQVLEQTT